MELTGNLRSTALGDKEIQVFDKKGLGLSLHVEALKDYLQLQIETYSPPRLFLLLQNVCKNMPLQF